MGLNDPFAGVAQHLVLQGIPAIIAMQFEISDAATLILAQEFYSAIADGYPVEAALTEARKAIFVAGHEVEWGTPVLYSRASDGRLFTMASRPMGSRSANANAGGENLPGRGDNQVRNAENLPAPSRKMDTPPTQPVSPAAQPSDSRPATVVKRTPTAGDEQTINAKCVVFPFVYVPAGPFQMGSNDYDDEKPIHTMHVDTFWLGKTPVANAQFRLFVESGGYTNQALWTTAGWQWRTSQKITQPGYWTDSKWNTPQQPVVGVSWYEAMAYAAWLAQATGQAIRLPTEAEWEKGARHSPRPDGGFRTQAGRKYPWGDDEPDESHCNFNGNVGKTTPVGSYSAGAGPYGALDMAGNVWEWTATKWIGNYANYANVVDNDQDGDATRALRGGSWSGNSLFVRSANRVRLVPSSRDSIFGFRLVFALGS